MVRLSSNYESRSRYRHGRLAGRRSRALQHADGADDRPRADRERTGARGRRHAADREFASRQARGRRPDRAGKTGPPSLLPPRRSRCRRRAGRPRGPGGARRPFAGAHRAEGSGAAPRPGLLRSSRRRSRRADARQHETAAAAAAAETGHRADRGGRALPGGDACRSRPTSSPIRVDRCARPASTGASGAIISPARWVRR